MKALGNTKELNGSSKRASKAQRRDIPDLLSFGEDETSIRHACAQPAQPAQQGSVQHQPAAKHPLYMGREETLKKRSGLGWAEEHMQGVGLG